MKNFLDLLATKKDIEVHVRLRPICDNGEPRCCIKINQSVMHDGLISGVTEAIQRVALTDPILIEIEMTEKKYSAEKETAVIIESIKIDGFDMIPAFTHLSQYDNERGYTGVTSYLGFNGKWSLDIAEPFYRWRHRETGQGWLLDPISGSRD
jgi:hypothetical protein